MITLFSSYLLNEEVLTHKEVKKALRYQVIKDGALDTIIYELDFISFRKLFSTLKDAYKNDELYFESEEYEIDFNVIRKFGLGNTIKHNILPINIKNDKVYCLVKSDISNNHVEFMKKELGLDMLYHVIPEILFESLKQELEISKIDKRFSDHNIKDISDFININILKIEEVSTSIESDIDELKEIATEEQISKEESRVKNVTIDNFKDIEKNKFSGIINTEINNNDDLEKALANSIEDKELIIDTLFSYFINSCNLVSFWGKTPDKLKLVKYIFNSRELSSKIDVDVDLSDFSFLNKAFESSKYSLAMKEDISSFIEVFGKELSRYYDFKFSDETLIFPVFIKDRWIGLFFLDNESFSESQIKNLDLVSELSRKYLEEYILLRKQGQANPISETLVSESLNKQEVEEESTEEESTEEESTEEESTEEESIEEESIEEESTEELNHETEVLENEALEQKFSEDDIKIEQDLPSIELDYEEESNPHDFNEGGYYFKTKELYVNNENKAEELDKKKINLPILNLADISMIKPEEEDVEIDIEEEKPSGFEQAVEIIEDKEELLVEEAEDAEETTESEIEENDPNAIYIETLEDTPEDEDIEIDQLRAISDEVIEETALTEEEVEEETEEEISVEVEEKIEGKLELELSNIIIEKSENDSLDDSIDIEVDSFEPTESKMNIEINLTEEEVEVKNDFITINSDLATPINITVEDFIEELDNCKRKEISEVIKGSDDLDNNDIMDKILEIFPGKLWMNQIDSYNFIVPIEQHGAILYYMINNKDLDFSKLKDFFNDIDTQKKFYAIYIYTKIKDEDIIPSLVNKITDRVVALVAIKALENHKNFKAYTRIKYKFESAVHSKLASIMIDWISAIRMLRDEFFVPILIDALGVWKKDKNIKNKIVELLVELTKQNISDSEKKWQRWWRENQYKTRKEWILDGLIHKKKKIRISALNEAKKCFSDLYSYNVDLSDREVEFIIDKIKKDEYDKRRGLV